MGFFKIQSQAGLEEFVLTKLNNPKVLTNNPSETSVPHWFAMRDLKRQNAHNRAYQTLAHENFIVFTPMKSVVRSKAGHKIKEEIPAISDLLFVNSSRADLDPVVQQIDTLQYRYIKGGKYCEPLTVPDDDMNRFIAAVSQATQIRYYQPEEITPEMIGRKIRMVCEGPLNGKEGRLLKIKGSGKKRLLVELPGLLAAAVEISTADYIEIL